MAHAIDPATPAQPLPADYTAEIRFGVVMYGGVSLAIYINGVANEMFEMACATPRWRATDPPATDSGRPIDTREVFRRLSWLVRNPALCRTYAQAIARRAPGTTPADVWDDAWTVGQPRTRLVVDVVSGTSAGGINGLFLAKALANGEAFASLRDLWIAEGDIGLLLNDARSWTGLPVPRPANGDRPASLLNSDRMYLKLLQALDAMPPLQDLPRPDGASPLVDEIDLFVTTTDILGAPVPLRLSDKVVYERRHKQVYHFGYPEGTTEGNDFAPANNPFLAFAARCTSSFPFAFEPMNLASMLRLHAGAGAPAPLGTWDRFFAGLPEPEVRSGEHQYRAFGDGGYLDNKPFSYAVDILSHRQAEVPVARKLVYVEPSPEQLHLAQRPRADDQPDAVGNALAALTRIPQYETIRDDLQAVLQRNRRVERVENIVRQCESAVEALKDDFQGVRVHGGAIAPWASLTLDELDQYYGVAMMPYWRLRVFTVTDMLASRLARLWNIDRDSDLLYALRALVRAWRERHFDRGDAIVQAQAKGGAAAPADAHRTVETLSSFMDQFDLEYRIRRVRFLLRKIDQATSVLRQRQAELAPAGGQGQRTVALSDTDRQIVDGLRRRGYDMADGTVDHASVTRALDALRHLKRGLLQVRIQLRQSEREGRHAYAQAHPLDDTLRQQLIAVLNLLLGVRPPAAPGAAGDTPVLTLTTLDGGSMQFAWPDEWHTQGSASLTQQEGVIQRARRLYDAAGAGARTHLQDALESGLEPMRVKRSWLAPDKPEPALSRINDLVKSRIGFPHLVRRTDGTIEVTVADTVAGIDALNTDEGRTMRCFVGQYYLRFDLFDQLSFPLYYDTGTGEPSTVDVLRISPADATRLVDEARVAPQRHKLAGTALFNFGAFLDERWRRNDIMWGRLDGVERLVDAMLPTTDADTQAVRAELLDRAHGAILRETLVAKGHGDLTDLLCKALAAMPQAGGKDALASLLEQLAAGNPQQRDRLHGVLASLLSEQGLLHFMRQSHQVDRDLDPKATLEVAARAVTITGRVLDGVAAKRGADTALARWVARAGLMVQGLVAVSMPGTLNQRWLSHAMKVLYAFELVLLVAALVFGGPDARAMALSLLGATLGVHLLSLLIGDTLVSRLRWRNRLIAGGAIVLLVLAALGASGLHHAGWQALVCGAPQATADRGDWWSRLACPSRHGR